MSETLAGNSNISHYRIVSEIGAGRMSEVNLDGAKMVARRVDTKPDEAIP
jgi:hypothetical protein